MTSRISQIAQQTLLGSTSTVQLGQEAAQVLYSESPETEGLGARNSYIAMQVLVSIANVPRPRAWHVDARFTID